MSDNAASLTPEPSEGEDPCDSTVGLTIQKVWNDYSNIDGMRPEDITAVVWQAVVGESDDASEGGATGDSDTTFTDESGATWMRYTVSGETAGEGGGPACRL